MSSKIRSRFFLVVFGAVAVSAVACQGVRHQPVHIEPPRTTKIPPPQPPGAVTPPASDAGAEPADAAAEPASDAAAPSERARSQYPIAMITARDAAFLIDYSNSEVKQKAQSACEAESKGDTEKQGACLTKARDKFLPDVLRFRKDSETQTSLLVYKRKGSALSEQWVGLVALSEPSSDSVKIQFLNKGKGYRPLWQGKNEVVIHVPNEYSIELDDPVYGQLRYDAKIGLITE
jgi:hypothetical protein